MFNHLEDGITHINIYSKGKTELGRFLTNFAHTPVMIDGLGFQSLEGYWYWLSSRDDNLRGVYGYDAKKLGQSLPRIYEWEPIEFQNKIKRAINMKLNAYPEYRTLLKLSVLPFDHYYVYGDKQVDAGYKWIVQHIEKMRQYLKDKQ